MTRPLVRTHPWLSTGGVRGGLTTRVGFPDAGRGPDDDAARLALRHRLAQALRSDPSRLRWLLQVHGDTCLRAGAPGLQGEADALVSDRPEDVLLVSVADCGPVLLFDRDGPAFGVAHAGWRGLVAGILESTVEALAMLGARPERLRAWVGPCIGPARFEVGEEVAARFDPDVVLRSAELGPRPHVDLPDAIRRRLIECGLEAESIRVSGDCTYDRADLYWSYRREGGIAGRQLGFLTRA